MAKRKENAPAKVGTSARIRNIILAVLVLALIAAGVIYALWRSPASPLRQNTAAGTGLAVPIEIQEVTENASMNTPQYAREAISKYYTALATDDAAALHQQGNDGTAVAIENKWLNALDYAVDLGQLASPDVDAFPPAAGMWAGNTLYKIEDFYSRKPQNAITNDVTGKTGAVGWVYFDTVQGRWVIVDPTIPSAVSAPEGNKIEKFSSDRLVDVKAASSGALSNPWWSYAQIAVDISSTNRESGVSVTPKKFDEGITVVVPDSLTNGVDKAVEKEVKNENANNENANQQQPQQGQQQPAQQPEAANAGSSNSAATTRMELEPKKASGVCVLYRGSINDFNITRIGSVPLHIDGDIMPVSISTDKENVTPVFPVGNITFEEIQKLLTQEEIAKYNATDGELPAVPTIDALQNGQPQQRR